MTRGSEAGPHKLERHGQAMGTVISIYFWTDDDARADQAAEAVIAEMKRLDAVMTTWTPDSEVSRINAAAGDKPVVVSDETFAVIERAQDISKRSGGVFDITVGAFKGLWKFDQDMDGSLPAPADVKKRLALIGYKDLVLCGHSLGGGVVLQYALSYPQEVAGLILVGTGARLRVHPQYIAELVAATRDSAAWAKDMEQRYNLVEPAFRQAVIRKRVEVGPAVQMVDLLCCHHFDVIDRISQIKVPTLIICGTNDEMTPPKYSQFLHDHIAGSKMVLVDGGTHYAFMEKPQQVNSAIAQFLAGLR